MDVRKFKITVDGKTFDVEVEEIGGSLSSNKPNSSAPPPSVKTTSVQTNNKVQNIPAGSGKAVVSPMPGKIISINVSKGASVKKGETLLIMEAMKMEQEIKSLFDGVVENILVSENDTVRKNQEMIILS